LRIGPVNEIKTFVNQYNLNPDENATQVDIDQSLKNLLGNLNANWLTIKDNFTPVDIESYPGFTKIQKFELFLAHYSTVDVL
jgi:hypothetical protein